MLFGQMAPLGGGQEAAGSARAVRTNGLRSKRRAPARVRSDKYAPLAEAGCRMRGSGDARSPVRTEAAGARVVAGVR